MDKDYLVSLILEHKGKCLGMLAGIVFGLLIILLGFFKTLFLVLCGIIGLLAGKQLDEKRDIADIVNKILSFGYKR